MEKSALRFLILTALFQGALCALFGWNVFVPQSGTWSEARQYCREHHTDLASINTPREIHELLVEVREILGVDQIKLNSEEDEGLFKMWIGIYKNVSDTWKWSGGTNVSHPSWSLLHEFKTEGKCVAINGTHWMVRKCEEQRFPFWCFESHIVLVKEKITWEEAMEHCRHLDKELLNLPHESALNQALQTSRTAQTDHVWIGLRYLANTWLWINGSSVVDEAWGQGEMPQCPTWSHHCAALSLEGERLESWDCADTLNFLCY